MTLKSRAILSMTALMILPFSWYCTKETLRTPVVPAQPDVENVDVEEGNNDIPEFLPLKDHPRPIGGLSAIQNRLKYPEAAINADVQGQVVIHVLVNEEGNPIEVRILKSSGNNELDGAAIVAIFETKFTPGVQEGVPVKFWVSIPISFGRGSDTADTQDMDQIAKEDIAIEESKEINESLELTDTRVDNNNVAEFLPLKDHPKAIGGINGIRRSVKYPESAVKASIQGQVVIHALIDEDGYPVEFKVLKSLGGYGLDEAAIEAVRQTRFEPARLSGTPVKFWVSIPIKFQLKGGGYEEIPDNLPLSIRREPIGGVVPVKIMPTQIKQEEIPDFLPIQNHPKPIGGIEAIKKLVKYPAIARKAGIQGQVVLRVLINENGMPVEAKVLKSMGNSGLDEASIEAIMKSRFTPATQRNKPVKFWITIPIRFKLTGAD